MNLQSAKSLQSAQSAVSSSLFSVYLLLVAGCAAPPLFPPPDPPLVWPSAVDPPRLAYVGQIRGEADLQRPRSVWEWVSVIWGGPEPPAKIQAAHAVAVSRANVLYVADSDARVVHGFDLESREYRAFTDAGEGRRFVTPIGLALSGERLLVSDRALKTVTLLSPDGHPERVLGQGLLEGPVGVACGPVTGRVYVADVGSHRVRVFDLDGNEVLAFGGHGAGAGEFSYPTHIACSGEERLYVSDSLNCRVQVFDREGNFLNSWGKREDTPGNFSQPKGIACNSGGQVLVIDSHFENMQVFSSDGELLLAVGEEGTEPGQFWLPVGIFVGEDDTIWVGDSFNHRVQVFRFLHPNARGEP